MIVEYNEGKNYFCHSNIALLYFQRLAVSPENPSAAAMLKKVVAVLQKISIRKSCHSLLLENEIANSMLKLLLLPQSQTNLGDESLEYTIALLMNLSLTKQGVEKFELVVV